MRKLRRILLIVLGLVLGLMVGLFVGVRFFFPVEKAKEFALEKAQAALGREVTIETVEVSFAGGIGVRLNDLVVANPAGFDGEPFLTTRDVDLKVALWPLLRGRVRGEKLVFNEPRVRAWRRADGTDNFTFAAAGAETGPAAGEGGEAAAVDASIDRIEIRGGRIVFSDDAAGTGVLVDGLRLDSSLLGGERQGLRLAGSLSADSLRVTGEKPLPVFSPRAEFALDYDPAARTGTFEDVTLEAAGIRLLAQGGFSGQGDALLANARIESGVITAEQLLALAPAEALATAPEFTATGQLRVQCDVDFAAAREVPLDYRGTARLNDLVLTSPEAPAELRVARAEATFEVDRLEARILEATAGGEAFTGRVTIEDFTAPRIAGEFSGGLDLALVQPYLDPALEAELSGKTGFGASFTGPVDDPDALEVSGHLDLRGVRYDAKTLPEKIDSITGRLEFDRKTVTARGVTARTASSDFTLDGTMRDPLPYFLPPELRDAAQPVPKPRVEFTVRSQRLNIDRLFPPASPGVEGAPAAAGSAVLPEFPDLVGGGTVRVDTLIYSKVEFTAATARVDLANRTIVCTDARAQVYTGAVAGSTSIDLGNMKAPRYRGAFEARQIEAADFLQRFSKFGGFFYGKFDLDGSFDAEGLEPQEIRNSLTLASLADMTQGKIVTSGFAYEALSKLAARGGQSFGAEQGLKNLKTSIRAEKGRVILDGLKTSLGSLGDVTLNGSYGFAGDLDFSGTLLLSQAQTRKLMESEGLVGKVAELLGGGGGGVDRLTLPLTVGGQLTKPSLKVDYTALTEAAARNLKNDLRKDAEEKVGGKLRDLLGK